MTSSFQFFPCPWCVHCGSRQEEHASAVVWYTETSVTLSKCGVCGEQRDPFVELEFPLISLDLALHRVPAFRHVIGNRRMNLPNWLRYSSVLVIVEYISGIWVDESDPGWSEAALYVLPTVLGFGASFALFYLACVACLGVHDHELQKCIVRAFLVSKFPSLLLPIAIAWSYSSDFYSIIAVYSFTCSIAAACALPGMQGSVLRPLVVAVSAMAPVLVRANVAKSIGLQTDDL